MKIKNLQETQVNANVILPLSVAARLLPAVIDNRDVPPRVRHKLNPLHSADHDTAVVDEDAIGL
jgi:hypothetical protein